MDNTFPKKEKLKSRKLIERMFSEGASVSKYPLRVVYIKNDDWFEEFTVQAGFSVPKRNFKKAVDRNKVKRLIRETYRLNKQLIFNNLETSHAFMFLYLGKEIPDFQELNTTMQKLLNKFISKVQQESNS
ncbi:ribonuclease P protein component [Zhouia spongiae]|uniref:Ribonuclease P protein component n=1 Tax=Zhouia spongiae TaxID=2202721 RepID=A0ABY3YQD8_9FLAO|nr:ribonuclease P protein component [Zhouia spongiae]UNY99744.1 ribonuclease P protein component [Zhouia spongiae]